MLVRSLVLVLALVLVFTPARAAGDGPMLGFQTPAAAAAERDLEARFDAQIRAEDLRDWMKRLTARPHHLGSAYQKANADFLVAQFKAWGFDARLEEFRVLFPTPKTRVLELVAPEKFAASLREPAIAEDSTSSQSDEQLPTYNCYSIDGDVTGELVYVNYGVPADYDELASRGVDVKGKVVMARYGGSWRGIKPKVAAEHGAVGCIIYSDPRDDGYGQGDVYPKGAWRNENGAQRGSVADMPIHPGDPQTPFVGSTPDAKRLPREQAATLTKIPVLPISYADALPLLRALGGPVAPGAWRGALPLTYHLGPGPARVHLKLEFNWDVVPLYNVIAKLPGAERPDEWVIRGNHYDAWVNGASDPISGAVALMSEAKALGALAKSGWRPKRTIVYCLWDGEEQGLLGSTEWVETHAEELARKATVYINSDNSGRGFLFAGGSHTLERFVNEVARDVVDPQRGVSVSERLRASNLVDGSARERQEARDRADLRIAALGSGSDYSPFIQHLGVASLNLGFGGEDGGGSYHSVYDSFDHYTRFGDPGFKYGVALAQICGRAALRFANADVLPFEFSAFAETVGGYVKEVKQLADSSRAEIEQRNRLVEDGAYELAADPTLAYVAPKALPPAPYLDFAPLDNAMARVDESVTRYRRAAAARRLDPAAQGALDLVLLGVERALTTKQGLPGRPWYVHQIYAPGLYTGYGVKTLPGVREAIEQRRWDEANAQILVVARALEAFAAEVDRAGGIR